ncbi:MAG: L-aspartate oxidase [Chloroflexi bacterium]|jgi:L-aspartate oxidase|nr:L-aspartate oxidase [Chloroflexota bacterium]MBT7080836.1 L-aspartate oxidase [Chloroflexota bacterium]
MKKSYDYIIIGSGIAGLYLSLLAREQGSVLILTKGNIDECNTKYAQGGIAAAIGRLDTPGMHFNDTIAAGAGLCDEGAVSILTEEAADRIADLIRIGVSFDTVDGEIALTKEAAHSVPRILHAGGDATGGQIEQTLTAKVRQDGITVLENFLATEIIVENGMVKGVKAFESRSGSIEEIECRFLILATGGAGRLFKLNTNSEIATGDGVALAYRAGAEIMDMEFFQFHPTALRVPGVPPFLISEAVRGEGGILRNVENVRFMHDYSEQAELAPRDIVARSIVTEMIKTHSDRVFLDVTHLSPKVVTTRFPQIFRFCMDHGLDITRAPIPVAPAAHYTMGGVRTNIWGETNIAGLFACGETSCTGVHGANRLASNSLLEVLVFAKRIMQRTQEVSGLCSVDRANSKIVPLPVRPKRREDVPWVTLGLLQSLIWDNVGIVRSKEQLQEAADTLAVWQSMVGEPMDRPSYELSNLVLAGRLMTEAALIRQESRGAHFRSDCPETSPDWLWHIIFHR